MKKSAKDLIYEWHDRVWNHLEEAAIFELMDGTCVVHGLDLPEPGPKPFVAFYRNYLKTFSDIHHEIFELVQDGDHVVGHARMTATHIPTGKQVNVPFSISVVWKNGKAVEARNVVDFFSLLTQLGVLQPEIMTKAFVSA